MAQIESFEIDEIVKNNNLNFTQDTWNATIINRLVPFVKQYFKNKNKTINTKHSTKYLKRLYEKFIGSINISKEEFVIVMIICGFTYKFKDDYFFNIAEKDIKSLEKLIIY